MRINILLVLLLLGLCSCKTSKPVTQPRLVVSVQQLLPPGYQMPITMLRQEEVVPTVISYAQPLNLFTELVIALPPPKTVELKFRLVGDVPWEENMVVGIGHAYNLNDEFTLLTNATQSPVLTDGSFPQEFFALLYSSNILTGEVSLPE